MTWEFTKPRFLLPKPSFWTGDHEILKYRKQKILHLDVFLAIGHGLSEREIMEVMFTSTDAEDKAPREL